MRNQTRHENAKHRRLCAAKHRRGYLVIVLDSITRLTTTIMLHQSTEHKLIEKLPDGRGKYQVKKMTFRRTARNG